MKKIFSLVLAIAMLLSLSACGNSSQPSADSNNPSATSGDAASSVSGDIGEHHWVVGIAGPRDATAYYFMEKMAQELDSRTGGKITVDIYPDSTLGDDVSLLESLASKNVAFVVQNTAPEVNLMPRLACFDLPFAYQNIEQFREAVDDERLLSMLQDIYAEGGYKLLGFADETFRVMSSNVKVEKIGDFAGIKIRTMENANHMAIWEALGASPTPMAISEVYTCLQQGVISAQENPYATAASYRFQEVQDYMIQTNHLVHPIAMIMNLEEYNSLNDAEKTVIDEAFKVAQEYARGVADESVSAKMEEIEAAGCKILPMSDELYADCVERVQPIYDSIAAQVGQELVDAFLGK